MDIPWLEIWQDLVDFFLFIPRRLFELMLDGIIALLEWIPVPDWILAIPGYFAVAADTLSWGFYVFNFVLGLTIIISAYVLRFFIRRIPVVG